MPRCVLISGLGLMGGSLAAALSAAGWRVLLHHRRDEVAREAARRGWGEALTGYAQAQDAEIAVVCTPVSTIAEQVRTIAQATTAVITDVGSTKGQLVQELSPWSHRYLGSHPMAGSHLQGLSHADAALYRNRTTIITPVAATPPAALELVSALWRAVGSRVLLLPPEHHDQVVAQASHLPHILASAAAALLSDEAAPAAAGGFRDSTRVAASAPQLWADILVSNAAEVQLALSAAMEHLTELSGHLAQQDRPAIERWLEQGVAGRQRFERHQP
jgi:prephenate dehydrogenase